ncbi:MAG: M43 family zinc metalloprotease [Bacteroidota bacterium]
MKINSVLLFSALYLSAPISYAQIEKCGAVQNFQSQVEENPQFKKRFNEAELTARKWASDNKSYLKSSNNIVYIPVVFHCVYKSISDATYLHDSVFDRQIAVLNETYALTNSNFSSTRSIFDTIAADTQIRFCLAGQDTLGNPTSGIMRYQSNQNWFTSVANDAIKTSYPPWNTSKYLNVWTCDMSLFGITVVLGYASFPGGPPEKDGIVLQSQFVGFQNNGTENNLGRTMVHEAGHWLGLRHIWGDGQQSSVPCDSTDYVEDTPHASDASQTDCDTTKNTCSTESAYWTQLGIDPPDMVENYMDYSKDGCMTMFTKGQKERMWSFLNTYRTGMLNNPVGCNLVGINNSHLDNKDFNIFPNPDSQTIKISSKNENHSFTVEISDISGRGILFSNKAGNEHSFDISNMISGMYLVKIFQDDNFIIKKFIKN